MNQLTNPYWYILGAPLIIFMALVLLQAEPDSINLWGRTIVFGLLGYIAARYVGRAPILMWERNFSPEARNIVGWALCLVGFMLQIAYGWIYIAYDRPLWLSSQYWGASFVILVGVGLSVVASSVPRLPPFGNDRNGLSEIASIFVVMLSVLGVFIVSHIPQALNIIKSLFHGALSAI